MRRTTRALLAAAPLAAAGTVHAQEPHPVHAAHPHRHVVVPQARAFPHRPGVDPVRVTRVDVEVDVVEQVARTTVLVHLHNDGGRVAEGELLLPVPDGAQVVGFDFQGASAEPTAALLPAAEAREQYDAIVRRLKDPALLEFAGHAAVRSSVFPIPARGEQRVQVVLEQLLEVEGNRIDYLLPRSESLAVRVPWSFTVDLTAKTPVATLYSPSHDLEVVSRAPGRLRMRTRGGTTIDPGAFRFSALLQADDLTASMLAYPDPDGPGGWFLLLAGLAPDAADGPAVRREVTLVLDRSGSMSGGKFEQARTAALQVLAGLKPGEAFRLVDYSDRVEAFSAAATVKTPETVAAARAYLAGLTTGGGTNLDGALQEALRPAPPEGYLPLVLFLTDGLPTVGEKSEVAIREHAREANAHERRVFPFGVGNDVNAPLLDRLADESRAASTYVLPGEDVEVAVGGVFRRLRGPVLTDLAFEARDADGAVTTRALRDVYPARLPDLYEGDRLVLIGRYDAPRALDIRLSGTRGEARRSFDVACDLRRASARNDFIPRLWAGRRVAALMDEMRQAGADSAQLASFTTDPRWKELTDEILALSTRFGVMTEYTAFLALEGTDLADGEALSTLANGNVADRAGGTRWGAGAVNQGRNWNQWRSQEQLEYANAYYDASNERVEIGAAVQQVADRAFFRRGARWIDGSLVGPDVDAAAQVPDAVVELGSAEHAELVRRYTAEGRNGVLALRGEVLLRDGGRTVLLRNHALPPAPAQPQAEAGGGR